MKFGAKSIVAAAVAAAGVALSAGSASAYVACSGNVCWHVHRHGYYHYRPAWGVVVHPDNWRWRAHERYEWREHHGRGYWRDGVWVVF